MKYYIVMVREVHVSHRRIGIPEELASPEAAIREVARGDGDETYCEYSHTLDPDTWTVEEDTDPPQESE